MTWAVRFLHDGRETLSRFEWRRAVLPVSARRGAQLVMMQWGRRPDETGALPLGGWAKLTHIQSAAWDRFTPRPVILPVQWFTERDVAGQEKWFQVTRGQYLQGCVARLSKEQRVYVVTLDCAPGLVEYERWPRIVIGR